MLDVRSAGRCDLHFLTKQNFFEITLGDYRCLVEQMAGNLNNFVIQQLDEISCKFIEQLHLKWTEQELKNLCPIGILK